MNSQEILALLNNKINQWFQGKDKLVVAIDGHTGAGKTTLLENLASLNPDILPINRDDFVISRIKLEELLKEADDRSKVFELDICDNKKIEELITAFRQGGGVYKTKVFNPISGEIDTPKEYDLTKKILVIEGVFMFHPKLINRLWDKRIYLEGDTLEIDKRRIEREKQKWGKDYFPEDHPDSYFKQVIIALKRYKEIYKPEQVADVIINI